MALDLREEIRKMIQEEIAAAFSGKAAAPKKKANEFIVGKSKGRMPPWMVAAGVKDSAAAKKLWDIGTVVTYENVEKMVEQAKKK